MSEVIIAELAKQGILGIGLLLCLAAIVYMYREQAKERQETREANNKHHAESRAAFEAERDYYRGEVSKRLAVLPDMARDLARACATLDRIDERNGGKH